MWRWTSDAGCAMSCMRMPAIHTQPHHGPPSMHDASYTFLKDLLVTPSPSGFERPIQDVVRAWAKPLAQEVRTDRHGNVIAALNPEGKPRIMLAGHCDQIG